MIRIDRKFQLWVSKNGVVDIVGPNDPRPAGLLPFYSTDTRHDAEMLQVHFCRLSRHDNDTYFLNTWSQNVDGIPSLTAAFDREFKKGRPPTRESDADRTREAVASLIGEGVHTGLRKWCNSKESGTAWRAISQMPDGEWSSICDGVRDTIVEFLGLSKDRLAEIGKADREKFERLMAATKKKALTR